MYLDFISYLFNYKKLSYCKFDFQLSLSSCFGHFQHLCVLLIWYKLRLDIDFYTQYYSIGSNLLVRLTTINLKQKQKNQKLIHVIKVFIMGNCWSIKNGNHRLHQSEALENSYLESHQFNCQTIKNELLFSQA